MSGVGDLGRRRIAIAAVSLGAWFLVVGVPVDARAGGLWLFEDAGPTVGTASAGRAAIASDATTARGNPAGMTRLTGNQMVVGAQPLIYTARFDSDQVGTQGGGDGGNAGGVFPTAGFYYVHDVAEDWRVGFAFGSGLGLGVDYNSNWAGRYYVQEATFATVSAMPSLAYRVTDWLSIGGGAGVNYADLHQKAAINNEVTDPGVPDGQLEVDADNIAAFAHAGVLVEPRPGTWFGLTYTSKVDHSFEDTLSISGVGPNLAAALGDLSGSQVDLDINLPQQVMFSAYHQVTAALAVMANVAWQDWSDFGETNVTLVSSSATNGFTADREFDDTWHFAIGAQYQVSPNWKLSTGFAHDTSPVSDGDRTPDLPLDRQLRFSAGTEHVYSDDLDFGLAYTYLDGGDADIERIGGFRGTLVGDYETNEIHIVAAYLNYRW